MSWWEWNSARPKRDDRSYQRLRDMLDDELINVTRWHWFFDEPWSPWVVRVCIAGDGELLSSLNDPTLSWKRISLDEYVEQYGEDVWGHVLAFFEAASEIGLARMLQPAYERALNFHPSKLVHCAMNAWGYNYKDEIAFYGEFIGSRMAMQVTDGEKELQNQLAGRWSKVRERRGYFTW